MLGATGLYWGSAAVAVVAVLLVGGLLARQVAVARRSSQPPSVRRAVDLELRPQPGRRRRRSGIWDSLKKRTARRSRRTRRHIWERLTTLVDPAEFRPKLADDIEVKEFELRWGNDYAMIANPRDLIHYRLEPGEIELLKLMDGTRTVKEIVLERFQESGDLEVSGVADLVYELQTGNFLDRPFVDVEAALKQRMHPVSLARQKGREFVKTLSIEWKNAERLVRWSYDHGLKWFFTRGAQVPVGAVVVAGFVAFTIIVRSGQFSLTGGSLALGSLILLGMNYFLTFAHELGHALVLVHNGRRVKSAGFMIFFGSPAFFVESSDGLMMDRRKRILQAFAGPYTEMILAGVASILAWTFPEAAISQTLYAFAVLNYLVLFMNLIPLLELDGYWILSDLIQVPDLRPRSLSFIRHDLWHKLRKREQFTKQEAGLAAYGIIGLLFTIFSFYTAFFFWRAVFGDLIFKLWDGGVATRIILLVLALFLGGPAIRGAIALVRSLMNRIRAVWRQIRFRLERKWRVEAAELIDRIPLFDDVPVEILNDLAGRVRLRSAARGEPVVRQAARAEAFYVVRRGTLQVIEEDPESGNERVLRVLGPGESFGELGLVEGGRRTATVRAVEEAELFEIDKGTFERLLADLIRVPEFAPTIQGLGELRAIPCFSHLEPDELSELLDHGRWTNEPPGTVLVRQGKPGLAFYAIGSGQVEIIRDRRVIGTLGPGDYFGEVALLLDVPRTASVRTRTPSRIFRLDRKGFDKLVRSAFKRGTLRPHIAVGRTWQH